MTADDARAELEALLWRAGLSHEQVDAALHAADLYAAVSIGTALDIAERRNWQAERRAVLLEAVSE